MPVGIGSGDSTSFGLRIQDLNQGDLNKSLQRIASGLKINSASDDAAGLGISERLRSLTNGFAQVESNLQNGASTLQVAEGGLSSINDSLQRIRELSVQAANDTLTDEDRQAIQGEVNQLTEEIDRQAASTQFNGQPLFSGQFSATNGGFQVQSGANTGETLSVALEQTSATTLGVSGLDVSTRDAAANAVATVDTAISSVSGQVATIGSYQNRIDSSLGFVGIARENTLSALSQVRDANLATEAIGLTLGKIKQQSGLSAIAQGNLSQQNVLKLLGA